MKHESPAEGQGAGGKDDGRGTRLCKERARARGLRHFRQRYHLRLEIYHAEPAGRGGPAKATLYYALQKCQKR